MSDVTRILQSIEDGNPHATEELLPLVYDELRKLAAARIAQENPGQTLQATALVHEAYLRLVEAPQASPRRESGEPTREWKNRSHFFAAAAEAMRRILVENARRKQSQKHGGHLARRDLELRALSIAEERDSAELLALDEILDALAEKFPRRAELVKLRYFLGHTVAEAADILGIAHATAEEDWTYARAWLRRQWLKCQENPDS
jgi:RNA polymerase sigma factor (TIGR02999 family)